MTAGGDAATRERADDALAEEGAGDAPPEALARWRMLARERLAAGVPPEAAQWDDDAPALLLDAPHALNGAPLVEAARVPPAFLRLAAAVACHRDATRWDALYRVLWRLARGEPHLLRVATDPDVHRLAQMERAVRRATHKMKAFVRFRLGDEERYVAWFEPAQRVVERTAPFFARRFPSMRWSILTPDRCAHWDLEALTFSEGASRSLAPSRDDAEELWRSYYASIFNPARLKLDAMRAEMPKQYWKHLPEAALIAGLTRDAPRRLARMLAQSLGEAEPLPEELQATEPLPAVRGPGVEPRAARSVDDSVPAALAQPGTWDPVHDPGVLDARARARRIARLAPGGVAVDGGATVLVGPAGWTDPTLTAAGVFYPRDASTPEARLRHVSARYPLIEIDATYYAIPTRDMAVRWAERTPEGFTFDVKAHALMTGHPADVRRLPDWLRRALPPTAAAAGRVYGADLPAELLDEVWRRFLHAIEPLRAAGKLGALLLQYPRWLTPSPEGARTIAAARDRLGDVQGAVELRNRAWMSGRVAGRTLRLLEDLGLAYVIVDAPPGTESSMPPTVAVTSPKLAIFRLHGRRAATWEARNDPATERYRYLYDRDELARWTPHILDVAYRTQGVHVVHNNCHANYGTTNADEITELLIEADEERRRMSRERRTRA